jgi:FkbM family methyltransferase
VSVRSFAHHMFLRLGWDVRRASLPSSEEALLARFLTIARPATVLDVGANIGQYGLSLRKCGFKGRIVSFEALPAVHARLSSVAAQDPDWIAAPCCALGRTSGEARMNVAANSVSSSLLPMHDTHLRAEPDSRYVAGETVRVERLDAFAGLLAPMSGKLLLKVDTQGYEEEVLAGAGKLLESVSAMQLELSVTPLYQGAPSMRRVLELCADFGFELHGVIPGFYDEQSGGLLQMDGLFLKNDAFQT